MPLGHGNVLCYEPRTSYLEPDLGLGGVRNGGHLACEVCLFQGAKDPLYKYPVKPDYMIIITLLLL